MKKIIFLILILLSNSLYGQKYKFTDFINEGDLNALNLFIKDFINLEGKDFIYMSHYFSEIDLARLRLLRNTIFAKYGYKFNSIDLKNHFSKFSWYNGTKTNVDKELNDNEIKFIEFLKKMENNYPSFISEKITGYWIKFPDNYPNNWWAYDYNELYYKTNCFINVIGYLYFYKNGTFFFINNNHNKKEYWNYFGLYSFNKDKLKMNIYAVDYNNTPYSFRIYDKKKDYKYEIINFNENLIFYNKNINTYGEEVWECNFQKNSTSWKKISKNPDIIITAWE
jgi:hypothetical protein